jgi:hypothetical protein
MSQSARWFVDVSGKVFAGMGARTDSTFEGFFEEKGLERSAAGFVQFAYGFAPEPITPKHFFKRGPYGNLDNIKKEMDQAVEGGWLKAVGEGQYKLTAQGKETAKSIFDLAEEALGGLEALPEADMKRLIALLGKVVEGVRALPEPAEKWGFSWGRMFDRGPTAPLVLQLRRHMIDLLSYREDAHLASWQPFDVSGQLWEVLTFVWRDEAGTAAELVEKLPSRGYDEKSYAAALQDLAARGWVAQENGKYVTTEKGSKLRQQAEDTTDRYFDAPWASLSQDETEEAKGLLEKLAQVVKVPEEQDEGVETG